MCRRWRIELVLAGFVTVQAALLLVTIFIPVWNSAYHGGSQGDKDTNDTAKLITFLAEYENYCRLQLIPKSSNMPTATVIFKNLCPCVPDTLGKCLHLI